MEVGISTLSVPRSFLDCASKYPWPEPSSTRTPKGREYFVYAIKQTAHSLLGPVYTDRSPSVRVLDSVSRCVYLSLPHSPDTHHHTTQGSFGRNPHGFVSSSPKLSLATLTATTLQSISVGDDTGPRSPHDNHPRELCCLKTDRFGAPGWLGRLSVRLWFRS